MIKEYSSTYILYNTRIAWVYLQAFCFVDCGTSYISAHDESIHQFENGRLPIAGFPVFESFPVLWSPCWSGQTPAESECTPSTKFLPEISLPVFLGSHRAVKVTSSAQILRGRRVDFLAWEPTTTQWGLLLREIFQIQILRDQKKHPVDSDFEGPAGWIFFPLHGNQPQWGLFPLSSGRSGVQRLSTLGVGEKYSRSRFWGWIVFPVHGNQPQPRCLILRARFWNQPTANQPQFQGDILDLDFEGPCAMCMGTNRQLRYLLLGERFWRNVLDSDFGASRGRLSSLCMVNLRPTGPPLL